MKVVVTGATGNVGTALVERLLADEAGHEVVGVARRLPAWQPPGARFVAADVAEDDLTGVFRGAGAVVHLAWQFRPMHRPLLTWRVNVDGSRRVFDAVRRADVPCLVHASSVGAYSPGRDGRVDESWPTDSVPTAAYGREKAYVERLLDAVEASDPDRRVVRLRPAFVFSERSASEQLRIFAGPLPPTWLGRRELLPVFPWVRGLRFQALHAADAADAYARAVLGDARGAFNVAAEPVVDAGVVGRLLGARVVEVPPGLARTALAAAWHLRLVPAEPALLDLVQVLPLLDTTRARTELGWEPRVDAVAAVEALRSGVEAGAGWATPPLAPDSVRRRVVELGEELGVVRSTTG